MEAGYCRNNTENVLAICSFWRWRHFSLLEWISFVSGESFGLKNTNVKSAMLGENGCHHKYNLSCLAGQWWCYWWEVGCSFPGLCLFVSWRSFYRNTDWEGLLSVLLLGLPWRAGLLVCRQPERSDTNLMLWFIERVYLWVGRGFPEINRIFLFSVILGGCEGQLLDQGNSSWDLEESWTSPTQSIFHGSKHRAWWGWLWTHESLKYEKPLVGKAVSTFDSGLFFQTFVPALSWDSDKFKSIIEPVVWQRVAPKIAWGDPWGFWALLQAE